MVPGMGDVWIRAAARDRSPDSRNRVGAVMRAEGEQIQQRSGLFVEGLLAEATSSSYLR